MCHLVASHVTWCCGACGTACAVPVDEDEPVASRWLAEGFVAAHVAPRVASVTGDVHHSGGCTHRVNGGAVHFVNPCVETQVTVPL